MSLLLQIGLANVAVAAVLAVVAFAVGKVCRRPALVHSLWLLVLLKLVTPPLFWLPITWEAPPEGPPPQAATACSDELVAVPPPPPAENTLRHWYAEQKPRQHLDLVIIQSEGRLFAVPAALAMKPPPAPPPPSPEPSQFAWLIDAATAAEPWLPVVFWAWVLGAVAWFVWAGTHLFRFQRLLRFGRPAPEALQREADRLAGQMGLSRCPAVWLLPGALPPMVWSGVGRARVFFPQALVEQLSDDERASLLIHELAHVCRRDHWVRALELVVMGLYWWCPLVWWARRQVHVHEEECCDAWVVGEMPARSYASAILRTLDFLADGRQRIPVAASGLSTRVQQLKKRLTQIMRNQTPKRLSVAGQLTVVVLALLLLPLLPTIVLSRADPVQPVVQPVDDAPTSVRYAASIQSVPLTTIQKAGDAVAVLPPGTVTTTFTAQAAKPLPPSQPVRGAQGVATVTTRMPSQIRLIGTGELAQQYMVVGPSESVRFSVARAQQSLPVEKTGRWVPTGDGVPRPAMVVGVRMRPLAWLLESSPDDVPVNAQYQRQMR